MKSIAVLLAIFVSAGAQERVAFADLYYNFGGHNVRGMRLSFTQHDNERITMTAISSYLPFLHYLLVVNEQREFTYNCNTFGNIAQTAPGAYFYLATMSTRSTAVWKLESGVTLAPNSTKSIYDRAISLYHSHTIHFEQPNPPPPCVVCGWVR